MAAAVGLVGTLLMHICTNYEAIMNGTQPDGKFMMTEGKSSVTRNLEPLSVSEGFGVIMF
jgi:hypothetical protein